MESKDTPLRRLFDWCIVLCILIFTVFQIVSHFKFNRKNLEYPHFSENQTECMNAVYNYLETVNSLSTDMCQYAFSGNQRYINNYFQLLSGEDLKTAETILQGSSFSLFFSDTVRKEADIIHGLELYIFRLVAVATNIPVYQMDERLRNVTLSDEEMQMKPEQLMHRAQELAFSDEYRDAKMRFEMIMKEFSDNLSLQDEVKQAEYSELIQVNASRQQIMLILTGVMMLLIVFLLYRQMMIISSMLSSEKQYKDALITDSIGVFEVNLTHDNIESVLSEKNELISHELEKLNLKVPCPFSEFLGAVIPALPPVDAKSFERYSAAYFINQFNNNNRYITRESWYTTTDERHLYLRGVILLSRKPESGCIYALVVIRDITAEKLESEKQQQLVELSLRSGQQYLEALRTDTVGIYEVNITCDRMEHIISDTPDHKIARFFESSGFNLPGKASVYRNLIIPMLDEDCRDNLVSGDADYLISMYRKGVRNHSAEFWVTLPENDRRYLKITMLLRKEEGSGDIVGIVIIKDGTEVQLEMEKRQLELIQQKSSNEAKVKFFSSMSHDIRTPLNGIIGMIDLIRHHMDEPERIRDYIEKIDLSSKHLLSLVNDVLDMGAIESGKLVLVKKPVNLKVILDECCVILNSQLMLRDISFKFDAQQLELPGILSDSLAIKKILLNILGNAVKFTSDGGSISLKVEYSYSFDGTKVIAKFIVSDSGIGMSEEFQKKMFDPFTQENGGARTNYQGTGLGLSIVKQYVDAMEGTVSVTSVQNKGTTVAIELPFEIDEKSRNSHAEPDRSLINVKGLKVLLSDDNELNIEIVQMLLEDQGAFVTTASNGRQAVELFSESEDGYYDAIIMDIMMPIMDGIEATKAIRRMTMKRKDASTIPIIALTANAFTTDLQKTEEAGMTAHLSKPIVPDLLMETLTRCCRGS